MQVSAVRSAVLANRNLSPTESSSSKGPLWSPSRTIERDSLRSNFSCRKESTTPIVHLRGSSREKNSPIVNRLNPKARARLVVRALAWVKVPSTAGGQNTQVCCTWRFPDLDAGATWFRASEKGVPSSEGCARRSCHEEHEFRKPGPGGPRRRNRQDLFLVLADLAQCLCEKAHWGKRKLA